MRINKLDIPEPLASRVFDLATARKRRGMKPKHGGSYLAVALDAIEAGIERVAMADEAAAAIEADETNAGED